MLYLLGVNHEGEEVGAELSSFKGLVSISSSSSRLNWLGWRESISFLREKFLL